MLDKQSIAELYPQPEKKLLEEKNPNFPLKNFREKRAPVIHD
jgi:hypothetical protein